MSRRIFAVGLIGMLLGWLIGPIIFAAFASLHSNGGQFGRASETQKLLDVYRANLPVYLLFRTVLSDPDGRECGYEPEAIFPDGISAMVEGRQAGEFSSYEGYFALNRWIERQMDEAYIGRIGERISEKASAFEIEFLRRCIESTVLAQSCMERVSAFADTVERFPPKETAAKFSLVGGHEEKVVCLYLDGVAARRGLPLASPED